MRRLSRALALAALFVWASAVDWASVRVMQVQRSSTHPQITVLNDGKPAAGANVRILRLGVGNPVLLHEVTTGADGIVPISLLPIGRYQVVATSEKLSDDLELDVARGYSDAKSHFTLNLDCCLPATLEERVAAAEKTSEKLRIRVMAGTVTDPTGALVAGAQLNVLRQNQARLEPVAQLKADRMGHFSIDLPDGPYVLLASAQGFKTSVMLVEIKAAAESGGLRIRLQVGDVTE
jgi:hypothetical protein